MNTTTTKQNTTTSAAGHTPGPWRVEQPGQSDFDGLTVESDFGLIVRLPEGDEAEADPENLANARLIAAAPELLEAIEAIQARVNGEWDHPALVKIGHLQNDTASDCLRIARAAIARATLTTP